MTLSRSSAEEPIARAEPLRAAVYARIVERISSGLYEPGAVLTEASLSRALDVSRTPVREALLRLEAEGVLESTHARGFTMRPLASGEVRELYPILANLEALAVRTANPLKAATLQSLDRTLTKLETSKQPVRRWKLDSEWHAKIVATAGNSQLTAMVDKLRTNLSRYELTYMREVSERTQADQQHRDILAALTAGEPDRAAALLEQHWHDGMNLLLDWLSCTH